jgi:hypothetical protein
VIAPDAAAPAAAAAPLPSNVAHPQVDLGTSTALPVADDGSETTGIDASLAVLTAVPSAAPVPAAVAVPLLCP